MPSWAITYFVLFAAICCGGIYLDLRLPEPVWYSAADVLSAICSLTAILAFWIAPLASVLGAALFITTAYALVWDCFSLEHDLKTVRSGPGPFRRRESDN